MCEVSAGETHGLHLGPPLQRGAQVEESQVMVIGAAPDNQGCDGDSKYMYIATPQEINQVCY